MFTMYGYRGSIGLTLYVVVMYYPIVKLKNARLSFWLSMGCLISSFSYIAWFHYLSWNLDFTTSLMGITIRLHTLSWDLIDYDKIRNGENLGKFKRFATFRREHACNSEQISMFNYMAYMVGNAICLFSPIHFEWEYHGNIVFCPVVFRARFMRIQSHDVRPLRISLYFIAYALCFDALISNEFMYISDNTIYERNGWRDKEHPPNSKVITKLKAISHVIATAAVFLFGQTFFNFGRLFDAEFQQNTPFWKMLYIIPMAATLNKC